MLNQMKDINELVSDFIILHLVASNSFFLFFEINNNDFMISGEIDNFLHLEKDVYSPGTHIFHNKEMTKPLRNNFIKV